MSIVGFRVTNHPQQIAKRGADDATDDRRTPPDLLAECLALAGVDGVDLDAAASAANALAALYFDRELNGLALPWAFRVWCNPPYSQCAEWAEKAHHEWHAGNCTSITLLLPANRTEQRWWQDFIEPDRLNSQCRVWFLARRRRFDRPGWEKPAKGDRPPFGLVVVGWKAP